MIRLLAILSFAIAVLFDLWSIHHGIWTWTPFMLIGLLLWCISDGWDHTPWRHQ
jgi:hypothetical protein